MGEPYLQDADFTLYNGDSLTVLRALPPESVDCCITSPPYWGLRDYSADGQLGLEPTPEEYVTRMVEVFREVRRVLAKHGTCWVNMGDSYAAQGGSKEAGVYEGKRVAAADWQPARSPTAGLKQKDLVGVPWRLAFALQADGWYLRSDIVWSKPNPMPESVTDRPTKAHEYVFLLSKQPRYFFDQEAVREPAEYGRREITNGASMYGRVRVAYPVNRQDTEQGTTHGADPSAGRNIRSVWEIATQPYPEAHFATFPEELVRRCLLAGCPKGGIVLDPFLGSGTTALVARKHGRRCVGIELNEDYCKLIAKRTQQLGLFSEVA